MTATIIILFILSFVFILFSIGIIIYMQRNDYFNAGVSKAAVTMMICMIFCMFAAGFDICNYINALAEEKAEAEEVEAPSAEELCEQYAISYTLVQTIAEYTGEDETNITILMKYCSEAGMEIPEAIKMCDSSLTEDECDAILIWSDHYQAETGLEDSSQPADSTDTSVEEQ